MKSIDEYKNIYSTIESQRQSYAIHNENDNFSDEEFFKRGIYSDILMNAESIVINIIKDNRNSQGIDSSARAIMESLLVLDMDKKGKIEPEQKTLYRLNRYTVEYYNMKRIFDLMLTCSEPQYSSNNEILDREKQIKEFCEVATKFHGVKITRNSKEIGDGDFYLREKGHPDIHINYGDDLIIKYQTGIDIENQAYMYHYFSQMIHPWYEKDENNLKTIMEERNRLVDIVLNRVMCLIKDNLPKTSVSVSFDKIYSIRGKDNNDKILGDFQKVFDFLGSSYDSQYNIPKFFFDRICYLTKDIFLLTQFGYYSIAVTKFKSISEMTTILYFLVQTTDNSERQYRTNGFCLSSRLRLYRSYKRDVKLRDLRTNYINTYYDLRYLYANFYYDAYLYKTSPEKESQKFFDTMSKKGFYPLDKDANTITQFVSEWLARAFDKFNFFDELYDTYHASLNLEHGIGYCYNSSYYTDRLNSIFAIEFCFGIFKFFYKNLNIVGGNFDNYISYFAKQFILMRYSGNNDSFKIVTGQYAPEEAKQFFNIEKYLLNIEKEENI